LSQLESSSKSWANYLIGILYTIQKRGVSLKGFDCAFSSNIPIGSGLSSSAALECGFALGVDKLLGIQFSKWDIVHLCKESSNNFLGIQSGILDQFSSMFGEENKAMVMDCSNYKFEYVDLDLEDFQLLLINTCVQHSHLTSGYNDRANTCKKVLEDIQQKYPEVQHLSHANQWMINDVIKDYSSVPYRRARFIIEENQRVKDFQKAILEKDFMTCGELLYASHDGLQNLYEVSCEELDFLVDATRGEDQILGARMMGGGFGGCTINLISKDYVEEFSALVAQRYKEKFGIACEVYAIDISEGAGLIEGDIALDV